MRREPDTRAQRLLKLATALYAHSPLITGQSHMVTTRPCTATCVIEGMPVTLTFYPDNGVLRIADPSGTCIRETRWHSSWRALLEEFSEFNQRAENNVAQKGLDGMAALLDEQRSAHPMQSMALA
jgi:hypothetical protein